MILISPLFVRMILPASLRSQKAIFRLSCLLWFLFISIIVLVTFNKLESPGNVFFIYRSAAISWLNGESIYEINRFLYFPSAAILLSPISHLSFELGGAIWRIVNISLFAFGLWKILEVEDSKKRAQSFLFTTALTLPLIVGASKHGQMTLAMSGIMMLACRYKELSRWGVSGFLSVMAVALKPTAIVLLLTISVLNRRSVVPIFCSVCLFFLFPFMFHSFDYVLGEYQSFYYTLLEQLARGEDKPFQQIYWLADSVSISLGSFALNALRAIFAIIVLLLVMNSTIRTTLFNKGFYLYCVTTIYILLMGSGTEANTYAMLSPVIGYGVYLAMVSGNSFQVKFFCLLFVMNFISKFIAPLAPETIFSMLKPLSACFLFAFLIQEQLKVKTFFKLRDMVLRH